MLNVFKALTRMRNFQTKQIHSIGEIDEVFNKTMSPKKNLKERENDSMLNFDLEGEEVEILEKKAHDDNDMEEMRAFEEIKRMYKLFDYCASGEDENIEFIINCFKNDPEVSTGGKPEKSKLIVNKLDNNGKSLLYAASTSGNLNIVKILLEYGGDIFYRCKVRLQYKASIE